MTKSSRSPLSLSLSSNAGPGAGSGALGSVDTSSGGGGGGVHQFISDFFRTDIMNHCEFLKRLNSLSREDDCYLIAEICERLVCQTRTKRKEEGKEEEEDNDGIEHMDPPFYGGEDAVSASDIGHIARDGFQTHKSFPRNCYNIIMVYASLKKLRGHEYNIYELAYLDYHSSKPFRTAIVIFLIQIIVLWIVLQYNFSKYEIALHQGDSRVILIDICTTIFFTTFCYGQYSNAKTFTEAVRGVIGGYMVADEDHVIHIPKTRGKWQPELMLFMNEFINERANSMAPIFNFYFILLSDSAMDALLNSFSLLFIFELDDYILPLFDDVDIEDKLVVNAHDFIMIPLVREELTCRRLEGSAPPNAPGFGGVKLYVSLQKEMKSIIIYSRVTATNYNKTVYVFDGIRASKFLSMCEESLQCLQNFQDIHD